ncbi:MAG: sporulation membrane protein YtaF [Firmicutes bacterium]|nr:sporulation membrane protein YtaF [Bacillota bacterium]
MNYLAPMLLAIALSIDGFAVGLAYGIRKIKVTFLPTMLIVLCSVPAMAFSMFAGQLVASLIPFRLAGVIGGSILMLIGFWQLIEGLKKYKDDPILLTINLKTLGLVLQVIREPENADVDRSGDIDYKEALLLGVALNIDVAGAGLGAGIAGYSFLLIPLVTTALFLAFYGGLFIGKKFTTGFLGKKGYILPGIMLVFLGLINIIR